MDITSTTTSLRRSQPANARRNRSTGTACQPSTLSCIATPWSPTSATLPDTIAARVLLTDALGTEDLDSRPL